ncbi:MAG TPA: fibronectin type III domain-containing protein [Chloroflexi bacterium]|nr:fibronectin type III domain-containing protein [Chloroflexota bacterium]
MPDTVARPPIVSAPEAPHHVRANSVGGDQIDLFWEAPADVPAPIFRIYWDQGLGCPIYVLKTSVRATTHSSTGLRHLTTYRYLLTVYDGQSESKPASVEARTHSWLRLPLTVLASGATTRLVPPAAPLPTPTPRASPRASQTSEVTLGLMTTTDYVDELGALHLVGEVHNDTAQNVDQIRVRVTFYDEAGKALETIAGSALLDVLIPGRLSPFVIVWENPPEWKRYSLRASARTTTQRPQEGLTLVHSYARLDDSGLYHVVGTVRNDGLTAADHARVVVSLYDPFGKIANAGFAYVQPTHMPPGTVGRFDCVFDYFPYQAQHMAQIAAG